MDSGTVRSFELEFKIMQLRRELNTIKNTRMQINNLLREKEKVIEEKIEKLEVNYISSDSD